MPQFAVDPRDAGDEAVRLDRAKDCAGFGIYLMDLPVPVLTDPERPFGPREAGVTTAARCRDRREHPSGFWIDLQDAIFGDLKQMLTVEGRAGMRGAADRARDFPAAGIKRRELVAGRKPDVST